jgi:hypothetical protein
MELNGPVSCKAKPVGFRGVAYAGVATVIKAKDIVNMTVSDKSEAGFLFPLHHGGNFV